MVKGHVMHLTDKEINDLVFYTFRYCLGRKSYACNDANKYIRQFISHLTVTTLHLIQKEILQAIVDDAIGAESHKGEWQITVEYVKNELEKRNDKGET
jgi:hypothetical protein